jgi:hypothetical protein
MRRRAGRGKVGGRLLAEELAHRDPKRLREGDEGNNAGLALAGLDQSERARRNAVLFGDDLQR